MNQDKFEDHLQDFYMEYHGPKQPSHEFRSGVVDYHAMLKKQLVTDVALGFPRTWLMSRKLWMSIIRWIWNREMEIRQDYESGIAALHARIDMLEERKDMMTKVNQNLVKEIHRLREEAA